MCGEPGDADRDSLDALERQTKETLRFFSNPMKAERERVVCARPYCLTVPSTRS
jgi:hypothetical protein